MFDMTTPTRCEYCGCDRQDHTPSDEVEALNGRLWDAVQNGPPMTCGDCYDCTTDPEIWLRLPDLEQRAMISWLDKERYMRGAPDTEGEAVAAARLSTYGPLKRLADLADNYDGYDGTSDGRWPRLWDAAVKGAYAGEVG